MYFARKGCDAAVPESVSNEFAAPPGTSRTCYYYYYFYNYYWNFDYQSRYHYYYYYALLINPHALQWREAMPLFQRVSAMSLLLLLQLLLVL